MDRFADRHSIYGKGAPLSPGRGNGTPRQTPGKTPGKTSVPGVERYATLAERLLSPPPPPKPDPCFASKTDRFNMPGGVYESAKAAGPGVGTYYAQEHEEPEAVAAKERGAVKLQAAVRRRQSRGIFVQREGGPVMRAAIGKAGKRCTGPASIYPTDIDAPGPGDYQTIKPRQLGGMSASFRSSEDRFAYLRASAATPGVGEYESQESAPAGEVGKQHAAFVSSTKRDALPGSVYGNIYTGSGKAAATPGVGRYTPVHSGVKARGAVKLQAAVRRRQSRGLYEQRVVQARAAEVDKLLFVPLAAATRAAAKKAGKVASGKVASAPPPPPIAPPPSAAAVLGSVPQASEGGPDAEPAKPRWTHQSSLDLLFPADEDDGHDILLPLPPMHKMSIASTISDINGLDDDMAACEGISDGEVLFSRLERISPLGAVRREQYFLGPHEWNVDLLRSNLQGEWLYSQLERISEEGLVSRDQYFHGSDGWDLQGLRSDLQIAMEDAQGDA